MNTQQNLLSLIKMHLDSLQEKKKFLTDLKEAQWFERAMKRSNYITTLLEVKGEFFKGCSKGDW